jgi:hypothetical protein
MYLSCRRINSGDPVGLIYICIKEGFNVFQLIEVGYRTPVIVYLNTLYFSELVRVKKI